MSESRKPYYSRKSENDPDGADDLKLKRKEEQELLEQNRRSTEATQRANDLSQQITNNICIFNIP